MVLGADQTNQTNNLVFIKHHHQLHIGKNVEHNLCHLCRTPVWGARATHECRPGLEDDGLIRCYERFISAR